MKNDVSIIKGKMRPGLTKPHKTKLNGGCPLLLFLTMTLSEKRIKRLCPLNSIIPLSHFIHKV
jgi:hypothetical protein